MLFLGSLEGSCAAWELLRGQDTGWAPQQQEAKEGIFLGWAVGGEVSPSHTLGLLPAIG